jgi:hypothetical protein
VAVRFADIQAAYGAHRVATYPLKADKTPAVSGYGRIGAPYSAKLARRFPNATAAGFVAGPRNRMTIIDIDSPDDRLAEELEGRFGATPFRVRTPSGGRHLYYRHGGERRQIRALPDVDILGAGNVVAALSIVSNGRYQLERGTLDDLDRLPQIKQLEARSRDGTTICRGQRNTELFRYCRSIVDHCDTYDQLLVTARTWADRRLAEPMPDAEVVKTAASVWRYRGGRRRVMNHIAGRPVFSALSADPAVLGVYAYPSAENGPGAEFMIADGLGPARGWPRRLVPEARRALLVLGIVERIRPAGNGLPALFRWKLPSAD